MISITEKLLFVLACFLISGLVGILAEYAVMLTGWNFPVSEIRNFIFVALLILGYMFDAFKISDSRI